jgi:hypothetical protein
MNVEQENGVPLSFERVWVSFWRTSRKINALAEKLVSCALAGEGWAFKEIGDRLEGKAVQPLEHREDDRRDNINQFTEAELTAMLRSRMKTVPVETDEERPEGEAPN